MEDTMRSVIVCFGLLVLIAFSSDLQSLAYLQEQQEDDVRGAFLTTRPKSPDKPAKTTAPVGPAKTSRRRPKTATTKPAGSTTASKETGSTSIAKTGGTTAAK